MGYHLYEFRWYPDKLEGFKNIMNKFLQKNNMELTNLEFTKGEDIDSKIKIYVRVVNNSGYSGTFSFRIMEFPGNCAWFIIYETKSYYIEEQKLIADWYMKLADYSGYFISDISKFWKNYDDKNDYDNPSEVYDFFQGEGKEILEVKNNNSGNYVGLIYIENV